jgi:GTP-binding protein HflX
LADTVGFIRKLPTQLVESFKSTLDEVREADVLLHVVDLSHKSFEDHIKAVNETIAEIDPVQKPVIMVFNKIDLYTAEEQDEFDLNPKQPNQYSLEDWMQTWMNRTGENAVFISAATKENLEGLREKMYTVIRGIHQERYPYNNFLFP